MDGGMLLIENSSVVVIRYKPEKSLLIIMYIYFQLVFRDIA